MHVLNPYGMAWLRRANENNVDLNRNFLVNGEAFSGAPELYAHARSAAQSGLSADARRFRVRAAATAVRYGFHRVKQAIAEGQYEYPQGLFFGGRELQDGPARWASGCGTISRDASYVFALDLHTGLGRRGTDTLIPERGVAATSPAALSAAFERALVDPHLPSVAYTVRGSFGSGASARGSRTRASISLLQEIGTCPPVQRDPRAARGKPLAFFRRWQHRRTPPKQRLREALCPAAGHVAASGESRAASRWRKPLREWAFGEGNAFMSCELCERTGGELLWQGERLRIVHVDEAGYPGYCRVIWQAHVKEMTDLSEDDRLYLMEVVFAVESVLREQLDPEKVNLASLGNAVPHLHWHVIPRFSDDPHYPQPIWSTRPPRAERALREANTSALASALAAALD